MCLCCWQKGRTKKVVFSQPPEVVAVHLASRLRRSTMRGSEQPPKRVSFRDGDRFIDQCRAADVSPERMIQFLQLYLESGGGPEMERASVERLLFVIEDQLRGES
jgi:hypothetical protein